MLRGRAASASSKPPRLPRMTFSQLPARPQRRPMYPAWPRITPPLGQTADELALQRARKRPELERRGRGERRQAEGKHGALPSAFDGAAAAVGFRDRVDDREP